MMGKMMEMNTFSAETRVPPQLEGTDNISRQFQRVLHPILNVFSMGVSTQTHRPTSIGATFEVSHWYQLFLLELGDLPIDNSLYWNLDRPNSFGRLALVDCGRAATMASSQSRWVDMRVDAYDAVCLGLGEE